MDSETTILNISKNYPLLKKIKNNGVISDDYVLNLVVAIDGKITEIAIDYCNGDIDFTTEEQVIEHNDLLPVIDAKLQIIQSGQPDAVRLAALELYALVHEFDKTILREE